MQLRRMRPLANGRERGTPITRYFWDQFLETHRRDVRGDGLEIGVTQTLRRLGGDRLTRIDALDLAPHSGEVRVVADLSRADHVEGDAYDCFILPFTMHHIYDVEAALYHSLRLLKPLGVLLVNFPCVEYTFPSGVDMGTGRPLFIFWQFTPLGVQNLLRRVGVEAADFTITSYGNLMTRVAYSMNLPAEELSPKELGFIDPGHSVLICARIVKPPHWNPPPPTYRDPWLPDELPHVWNERTSHYSID